jgi:hypothetical protein
LTTFLNNWQDSWANSLVAYHPEWYYYYWCEENHNSYKYDDEMRVTTTFSEAQTKGLINPLGLNNPGVYQQTTYGSPQDPFLTSGNIITAMYASLFDVLQYQATPTPTMAPSGQSVADIIYKQVHCPPGGCATPPPYTIFAATNTTEEADKEWNLFRAFYLGAKDRVVYNKRLSYLSAMSSYFPFSLIIYSLLFSKIATLVLAIRQ